MSRSERYIAPSDQELERMRQSIEAAKQFDHKREQLLRRALKRCKKEDLVELALRIAKREQGAEWLFEQELELDKPVDLLVHDIGIAIDKATQVDEKRLNYNFDFDHDAYETVRDGLSRLIRKDGIEEAKELALTLMRKGSFQIECSDEGLMQEEIESCLRLVITAVAETSGGSEWALKMLEHDRIRCLCQEELRELAGCI